MLALLVGVSAFTAAPLLRPASSLHSSSKFAPAAIVQMQATPEPRILTEENAIDVLNECMADIGTMFGTEASSRGVGITGEVEFVELDGPILVVRLKGRFWHQRTRVVERVESYVLERIPECVEVVIEDAEQLDDSDPDELEMTLDKAFADPPAQFGNEKTTLENPGWQ